MVRAPRGWYPYEDYVDERGPLRDGVYVPELDPFCGGGRMQSQWSFVLELATELVEHILGYLEPNELVQFGRTCRTANSYIHKTNKILWKTVFLNVFDDPRDAWTQLLPSSRVLLKTKEDGWDWYREVGRRMHVARLCEKDDQDALQRKHDEINATLLDTFETTPTTGFLNLRYLEYLFTVSEHAERIVHDFDRGVEHYAGSFDIPLDRPITRSMVPRQQVSAEASKLHIFYGRTFREINSVRSRAGARAVVYDWAITYAPESEYGPFMKDRSGKVNWASLEAIASLMARNYDGSRDGLINPSGFRNHVRNLLPMNPKFPDDWAGVSGMWAGTYAFLDYRDLVHYNRAHYPELGAGLDEYEEATGDVMILQLDLDHSIEAKEDKRLRINLPVCEDLPQLYFTGISRGHRVRTPRIYLRGTVALVPGGLEVRWRFIINYAGADQWQLEGVQPGGVRSGGIFGMWTHCDHEANGPLGPFSYYPYRLCASNANADDDSMLP